MKSQARVVVIGGGAMGVSLIYHLTKRGWRDVVLVEKNELTAGSTWHAAGLCTHFAHNPTIMEMRAASVRLYRDILPAETGAGVGFHPSGALRITRSPDRMDEFRQVQGLGRFVGYDFHILSPAELQEIYPLCVTDGLLGAIYEPDDGHVDPTLATNAMAKVARDAGAEITRHTQVIAVERGRDDWLVRTDKGEIRAEQVVNAAGTWCREIGEMMGLDLPVVPMLHQYVVTDRVGPIAERTASGEMELPIIRDPEESWYLRQERDGLIVGPYETEANPWSVDGLPPDFGMELLPPDLDRIEHIVARAMERVPALAEAGIKTIVNGPITFTPDANPLIGPAFGLAGAWLLTGSSMGVMEGGGAGRLPGRLDRRWGPADGRAGGRCPALRQLCRPRLPARQGHRMLRPAVRRIHYPFEERPAGRPRRTTSDLRTPGRSRRGLRLRLRLGAAQLVRATPLPHLPPARLVRCGRRKAVTSARRSESPTFPPSPSSRSAGPGAEAFLSGLGANRLPKGLGRIGLTHALTPAGGVSPRSSPSRGSPRSRYYLTSAAAAERRDEDLLRSRAAGFEASRSSTGPKAGHPRV